MTDNNFQFIFRLRGFGVVFFFLIKCLSCSQMFRLVMTDNLNSSYGKGKNVTVRLARHLIVKTILRRVIWPAVSTPLST